MSIDSSEKTYMNQKQQKKIVRRKIHKVENLTLFLFRMVFALDLTIWKIQYTISSSFTKRLKNRCSRFILSLSVAFYRFFLIVSQRKQQVKYTTDIILILDSFQAKTKPKTEAKLLGNTMYNMRSKKGQEKIEKKNFNLILNEVGLLDDVWFTFLFSVCDFIHSFIYKYSFVHTQNYITFSVTDSIRYFFLLYRKVKAN